MRHEVPLHIANPMHNAMPQKNRNSGVASKSVIHCWHIAVHCSRWLHMTLLHQLPQQYAGHASGNRKRVQWQLRHLGRGPHRQAGRRR